MPLLIFTSNSQLMGDLVNTRWVKQVGWVIVVLVVTLNIRLLVGTALGFNKRARGPFCAF
ncbi:manganese transporter [Shigella flexneri]